MQDGGDGPSSNNGFKRSVGGRGDTEDPAVRQARLEKQWKADLANNGPRRSEALSAALRTWRTSSEPKVVAMRCGLRAWMQQLDACSVPEPCSGRFQEWGQVCVQLLARCAYSCSGDKDV